MSRIRTLLFGTASVVTALAAWEVAGQLEVSNALPPLHAVVVAFIDLLGNDRFQEGVVSTATAIVISFPPIVVIGVMLGLAMSMVRPVRWALEPYLTLGLSLPLVSMIPILISIFGFGRSTIIAVIVVYTLPVIIVNTAAGFDSVDSDQIAMARSFGANRTLLLRRVLLPAAAPLMVTGIRLAAGRSIKGAIVAEQIVGLVGLGGLIQRFGGAFAVEDLYAVVLFIGVVGVASVSLIGRLERKVAV